MSEKQSNKGKNSFKAYIFWKKSKKKNKHVFFGLMLFCIKTVLKNKNHWFFFFAFTSLVLLNIFTMRKIVPLIMPMDSGMCVLLSFLQRSLPERPAFLNISPAAATALKTAMPPRTDSKAEYTNAKWGGSEINKSKLTINVDLELRHFFFFNFYMISILDYSLPMVK